MVYISADGSVGGKKSLWMNVTEFFGSKYNTMLLLLLLSMYTLLLVMLLYGRGTCKVIGSPQFVQ